MLSKPIMLGLCGAVLLLAATALSQTGNPGVCHDILHFDARNIATVGRLRRGLDVGMAGVPGRIGGFRATPAKCCTIF